MSETAIYCVECQLADIEHERPALPCISCSGMICHDCQSVTRVTTQDSKRRYRCTACTNDVLTLSDAKAMLAYVVKEHPAEYKSIDDLRALLREKNIIPKHIASKCLTTPKALEGEYAAALSDSDETEYQPDDGSASPSTCEDAEDDEEEERKEPVKRTRSYMIPPPPAPTKRRRTIAPQ